MGNEQSNISTRPSVTKELQVGQSSSVGFHVLNVDSGSPAFSAGLVAYFDYIVAVNGVRVIQETPNIVVEMSLNHVGRQLKLSVYNSRNDTEREIFIIPNRDWGGPTLLGARIRFCSVQDVADRVWRVMDVSPGSPASKAGLIPERDWIIGSPEIALNSPDDFYDLILQNKGRPVRILVYNCDSDIVRETTVIPDYSWGGEGCLGCNIASGVLHRIAPPSLPASAPSIYSQPSTGIFVTNLNCNDATQKFPSSIVAPNSNIATLPHDQNSHVSRFNQPWITTDIGSHQSLIDSTVKTASSTLNITENIYGNDSEVHVHKDIGGFENVASSEDGFNHVTMHAVIDENSKPNVQNFFDWPDKIDGYPSFTSEKKQNSGISEQSEYLESNIPTTHAFTNHQLPANSETLSSDKFQSFQDINNIKSDINDGFKNTNSQYSHPVNNQNSLESHSMPISIIHPIIDHNESFPIKETSFFPPEKSGDNLFSNQADGGSELIVQKKATDDPIKTDELAHRVFEGFSEDYEFKIESDQSDSNVQNSSQSAAIFFQ